MRAALGPTAGGRQSVGNSVFVVHLYKMSHAEHITMGDRGRLVLPARVRRLLGLHAGSHLALTTEPDGSLRLRPYQSIAEQARGLWANMAPASVSMTDELIAERRAEAARENAE